MKLTTFASTLLLLVGCVAHKKTVVVVKPPPVVVVKPPPVVVVKPPPTVVVVGGRPTGRGVLIARPPSCTRGEEYWATDVDTLYVCIDGSWEERYIPITYPVLPSPAVVATPTVRVMGVTQTQAVIDINVVNTDGSPYSGSCTVTVLDASGALAHDVDPALFTNANLDSRPSGTTVGNDRFFVVGQRVSNKGLDGAYYSRALEAFAPYTVQANCGGVSSAVVNFATANPPMGNGFPDAPNWDSGAWGNQAYPSINWASQDTVYIDPQTGIRLKRAGNLRRGRGGGQKGPFVYAFDASGSAWSNPQNALTIQVPGTLASTSTLNAKLFLAWTLGQPGYGYAFDYQPGLLMDDMLLRLYGFGATAGTQVGVCLTIDSTTCNTPAQLVTMPTGTATEVQFPASGFPQYPFAGWGRATVPINPATAGNQPVVGNVVITGGTSVRQVSNVGTNWFMYDWPVGTRLLMTGTSGAPACANNFCTLATYNTTTSLNIAEAQASDMSGSTLTAAVAINATTLAINGAGNLFPGNSIILDLGLASQERVNVASSYVIGSLSVPLTGTGVTKAHASGAFVYWGGLNDGSGTLSGATLANATSITLAAVPTGLAPGESFIIGTGALAETATATSGYVIGSTTVPLAAGLQNPHASGATVAWSNAITLQPMGGGLLVWLASGTSVSLSASRDTVATEQVLNPTDAGWDQCNNLPITDIATDRNGNPLTGPPQTGYLCQNGGGSLILFIPATGETRLMSQYWNGVGPGYWVPNNLSNWSTTDPKSFFAQYTLPSGAVHVYKGTLTNPVPGVYPDYNPGYSTVNQGQPINADSLITYFDLTANGTSGPIETQIINKGGPVAAALQTGLFGGTVAAPALPYNTSIGGWIYYYGGGHDALCLQAFADGTNTLKGAFTSFSSHPYLSWGACHSAPQLLGTDLVALTANNTTFFSQIQGPFVLSVLSMKHGTNFVPFTVPITAYTSVASPLGTIFTATGAGANTGIGLDPYFAGGVRNGSPAGPSVTLSGFTGASAAANGQWNATVAANNQTQFTIPGLDSSSWGALNGSEIVTTSPPIIHSTVTSVTAGTPAVVNTSNGGWGGILNLPQNHRFLDGDQVVFLQNPGSIAGGATALYAKASGYAANQFAVYSDQALTQPVSSTTLNVSGGSVYYAETCPSGLPPMTTSGMPFDNGGAVGARCITLRVQGQPCNWWSTTTENAQYPCKAFPGINTRSQPYVVRVNDNVQNLGVGTFAEMMAVVQVNQTSDTLMDVTLMRFYGMNVLNNPVNNAGASEADTYNAGWTPTMLMPWAVIGSYAGSHGFYAINSDTWNYQQAPAFGSVHTDTACGNAPGLITYAGGYGGPDSLNNITPAQFLAAPPTYANNLKYLWNGVPVSAYIQTYPGHRQCTAGKSELVWKGDFSAYLPAPGYAQGAGSPLVSGTKPVLAVPGTYSYVYKVPTFGISPINVKKSVPYSWAGFRMFKDISGPGSTITDSTLDSFCIAYVAGECVSGSIAGNAYVSAKGMSIDPSGNCYVNTYNSATPCVMAAWSSGGSAMQVEIDPIDTTGRRYRRLTTGFIAPAMHWGYQNWRQMPGLWGITSSAFVNGSRNDNYIFKLPPWQGASTLPRDQYVKIPVSFSGFAGAVAARARFGYAENGAPTSFFCTSRQETCSTDTSPTAGDPFSYLPTDTTISTGVLHQSCGSGCTIQIPTVPGRVLYYVIDALDGTGNTANVLWTSPLQIRAVN